jgi:hypothetical protein
MSMPNEPEPVILQNDGSNFLSWSIHVLTTFRAIDPLVEYIVDARISLPIVDWSNYRNMPEEEKRCVQLNAQAINVLLSTLSAEVLEEAIYDEDTPSESAHHIWSKLCGLYGKAKCDEAHELNMSMVSPSSQEASRKLQSIEPEHVLQVEDDLLPGCSYRTCPVSIPDVSGIGESARQQICPNDDDHARWRPSDESCSTSEDHHHLCLMAKKSKKKTIKKDQESKKMLQDDDQSESEIVIEDDYKFDHLTKKDKYIFLKMVERNEELEEEIEKQEESLHNQEEFLVSKLKEIEALNERFEKLSIEHALATNHSSSVSQLEKANLELKARLDELSSQHNELQVNYTHLKCSHDELVESHALLEVAHEVVLTSVKSSQPPTHSLTSTTSQLNISCANDCVPQASQSMIELNSIENLELKKEVERLKKEVTLLKGKEKAQPSQDNRDSMVKKLEKGSNRASSNTQQKNQNSSNANTTKSKKHKSRMCYGCGLYGHEWALCPHKSWADKVEATDKKASTKLAKQNKDDGPKVNKLVHPTKHRPSSQEANKKALIATRKCYGCNEKGHMINKCPNKQRKIKANL